MNTSSERAQYMRDSLRARSPAVYGVERRGSGVRDTRDLRDPQELGERILAIRQKHCYEGPTQPHPADCGLHRVADFVDRQDGVRVD